jgi:hypothetical protein
MDQTIASSVSEDAEFGANSLILFLSFPSSKRLHAFPSIDPPEKATEPPDQSKSCIKHRHTASGDNSRTLQYYWRFASEGLISIRPAQHNLGACKMDQPWHPADGLPDIPAPRTPLHPRLRSGRSAGKHLPGHDPRMAT